MFLEAVHPGLHGADMPVPAKVAKVGELIMASPVGKTGQMNPISWLLPA